MSPDGTGAPRQAGGFGAGPTVYYDGACPLCRAEIAQCRRTVGADRVTFVDAAEARTPLGPGLDRARALARFHLRRADGRPVSGAAAFAELWGALPRWRWLARLVGWRVLGRSPALALAEGAYRLSLPLRPLLARLLVRGAFCLGPEAHTTPRCL